VTLSFWVRSSLTGTFGGSLYNAGGDKTYPFTYTISAAGTWEKKSITVAGDTATALGTGTGIGLLVSFGLGVGSTNSATAGSWQSGLFTSATGATSVVGTNGATFYVTGVQLEKGSTATSFDYRPYGTEFQLCQRYFTTSFQAGGTPASPNSLAVVQTGIALAFNGDSSCQSILFPVTMRASPTVTVYAPLANPAINNFRQSSNGAIITGAANFVAEKGFFPGNGSANIGYQMGYTSSAEL
jgi:hypothetical protein